MKKIVLFLLLTSPLFTHGYDLFNKPLLVRSTMKKKLKKRVNRSLIMAITNNTELQIVYDYKNNDLFFEFSPYLIFPDYQIPNYYKIELAQVYPIFKHILHHYNEKKYFAYKHQGDNTHLSTYARLYEIFSQQDLKANKENWFNKWQLQTNRRKLITALKESDGQSLSKLIKKKSMFFLKKMKMYPT